MTIPLLKPIFGFIAFTSVATAFASNFNSEVKSTTSFISLSEDISVSYGGFVIPLFQHGEPASYPHTIVENKFAISSAYIFIS
ncbi:MAG: hypothetical protein VX335_01505 [Pseudomonadota bacterium]|nr:hypothetical protein [Pseudomonadota bacterium]